MCVFVCVCGWNFASVCTGVGRYVCVSQDSATAAQCLAAVIHREITTSTHCSAKPCSEKLSLLKDSVTNIHNNMQSVAWQSEFERFKFLDIADCSDHEVTRVSKPGTDYMSVVRLGEKALDHASHTTLPSQSGSYCVHRQA